MRPCCRDTVIILTAAAAVTGSLSVGRITRTLPMVKEPCTFCRQVAQELGTLNATAVRHGRAHPADEVDFFGRSIAYILENQ